MFVAADESRSLARFLSGKFQRHFRLASETVAWQPLIVIFVTERRAIISPHKSRYLNSDSRLAQLEITHLGLWDLQLRRDCLLSCAAADAPATNHTGSAVARAIRSQLASTQL